MTTQELEDKLEKAGQTVVHRINLFINEAPAISDLTIKDIERLQEIVIDNIPQQTMKHVKFQVDAFNKNVEELKRKISKT